MTTYTALLEHEAGTLWGVYFPDLPGCVTAGATAEEAAARAAGALRLYAETAQSQGETLPVPRALDALTADDAVRAALARGDIALRVPLLARAGEPVRVNVSLDASILRSIDATARAHGMTRSAFLAAAAEEKILRSA